MATAWEILTGNSTLPVNGVNTAWDHLNNQQGGGGGGAPYPVYITQTGAETVNTAEAEIDAIAQGDVINIVEAEADLTTEGFADYENEAET